MYKDKCMSKIDKIKNIDILHSLLLRSIVIVDRSSIFSIYRKIDSSHSSFFALASSKIILGRNVMLRNCTLRASNNSKIVIHENVKLENVSIFVSGKGIVEISEHSIVSGFGRNITWNIDKGTFILGHHSRVSHDMWIRYGGIVNIGCYSCVNIGSEIRCDENIRIGSYSRISFNVNIWDTNTHCIYSAVERRALTESHGIGYEYERPKTKPIIIGDDCWIGKNASILKGAIVGNKCIVGYGTTLINEYIADNTSVVSSVELKKFANKV